MRKVLGFLCLLLAGTLLAFGLWPFNPFPPNHVAWLPNEDGLRFTKDGVVFSSASLKFDAMAARSSCALELWLQPAEGSTSDPTTFLAFYSAESPLKFRLLQFRDELLLRSQKRDSSGRQRQAELAVGNVFRQSVPVLIGISVSRGETTIYLNGSLATRSTQFPSSCDDLTGQLILGSSPVAYKTWHGDMLGLALYDHGLSSGDALAHFEAWKNRSASSYIDDSASTAFYFRERTGRLTRNQVTSQPDLQIPLTFNIPHKRILLPPWKEFYPTREYVADLIVNVVGFIPWGFLFYAYLKFGRGHDRSGSLTLLAGFAISLTIELLQAFIPSRYSGTTDLITNTFGTGLGILIWKAWPAQLSRVMTMLGASSQESPRGTLD